MHDGSGERGGETSAEVFCFGDEVGCATSSWCEGSGAETITAKVVYDIFDG